MRVMCTVRASDSNLPCSACTRGPPQRAVLPHGQWRQRQRRLPPATARGRRDGLGAARRWMPRSSLTTVGWFV